MRPCFAERTQLGEVTMEKELLNEKINRMEEIVPLVPRWLKT